MQAERAPPPQGGGLPPSYASAEDSNVVAWKTERLRFMAKDKKLICGMEGYKM